jgi:hypothetical protein
MIVLYGRRLLKEKEKFQTKGWYKHGYGRVEPIGSGCFCNHKKTKS